jgi:aromatic ring-opening dioxygenase catalytic subunit (LigB family)
MAQLVAAYAVPHTPSFVADAARLGPGFDTVQYFNRIRAHFETADVDVVVLVQNDHFNTFFLNNWPTFAIGMADQTTGPSDQTPDMPDYRLTIQSELARHIHQTCSENDFDFASSEELEVDHGVLVPLHFLTPAMDKAIVPVFVNCLVPPLPSARRCHRLGEVIGSAIRGWQSPARVAFLSSGSLSLEVGGPLMEPGKTFGVPDKPWAAWIVECIGSGKHEEIVVAATPERMARAGNVGGELLNIITLLGAIENAAPDILINQPELGNAFAAWRLEDGRRS